MILVCFLHGKSWEAYCSKIAASLEPNIESFASSLAADNGIAEHDPEDECESYADLSELGNPGDTTESVAKLNQIEKNKSLSSETEDHSQEDSKPVSSSLDILNNKVEESTENQEN